MRTAGPNRLRRALTELVASETERDSADLQDTSASAGAKPVARCTRAERVCIAGRLRTVVVPPRGESPSVVAELYDGTGTVSLVWLGRRRIPGVEAGRSLVVRGRLVSVDGRRVLYNPDYELRAATS